MQLRWDINRDRDTDHPHRIYGSVYKLVGGSNLHRHVGKEVVH